MCDNGEQSTPNMEGQLARVLGRPAKAIVSHGMSFDYSSFRQTMDVQKAGRKWFDSALVSNGVKPSVLRLTMPF